MPSDEVHDGHDQDASAKGHESSAEGHDTLTINQIHYKYQWTMDIHWWILILYSRCMKHGPCI